MAGVFLHYTLGGSCAADARDPPGDESVAVFLSTNHQSQSDPACLFIVKQTQMYTG